MNKILILLIFVVGCATEKKLSDDKVEKISFSVASQKNGNISYSLVGSSANCVIKWEVAQTILTHRMNCPKVKRDELWAYLLEMSFKLKREYKRDISFVRFTTKDFPIEQTVLEDTISQSKYWQALNPNNIEKKKYKDFSNKYLKKVIEHKNIYTLIPNALNTVGYRFKVHEIEVDKYTRTAQNTLIPENIRVVFKN